jgi:hypothetical protein
MERMELGVKNEMMNWCRLLLLGVATHPVKPAFHVAFFLRIARLY